MTNFLGIDYGLAHVGLAISEHTLATPLKTLQNNHELLSHLKNIVATHHITQVVCGLPEGRLAPLIRQFATDLETSANVPVTLHPETLSSQEATQKLASAFASKAKKKNDHAYAACLILEDYLELKSTVY